MKYNKAPISEVIMGITLEGPQLKDTNIIFDIVTQLKKDYVNIQYVPPLADREMSTSGIRSSINPDKTGPVLYRLRTEDHKWLLQIQHNKIYLNWIRGDDEDPGNYPGFTSIFQKYTDIIACIKKLHGSEIKVKSYELTYQDRIYWNEYIKSLGDLTEIVNCKPFVTDLNIPENNLTMLENMSVHNLPKLHGFLVMLLKGDKIKHDIDIISFQSEIRGEAHNDYDTWFAEAHTYQFNIFESFFSKSILQKWK